MCVAIFCVLFHHKLVIPSLRLVLGLEYSLLVSTVVSTCLLASEVTQQGVLSNISKLFTQCELIMTRDVKGEL